MITTMRLACASCGTNFDFTAEEQEFYQSKGFQTPKKCKPCRNIAKQVRGAYADTGRAMYDADCDTCGVRTQVPFKPNNSKPIYCLECFQNAASRW